MYTLRITHSFRFICSDGISVYTVMWMRTNAACVCVSCIVRYYTSSRKNAVYLLVLQWRRENALSLSCWKGLQKQSIKPIQHGDWKTLAYSINSWIICNIAANGAQRRNCTHITHTHTNIHHSVRIESAQNFEYIYGACDRRNHHIIIIISIYWHIRKCGTLFIRNFRLLKLSSAR